jgi:heme/copper-type cytochrome/quinol oxidase subunit 2
VTPVLEARVALASVGAPDFSGLVWFVAFCAAVVVVGVLGAVAWAAAAFTRDADARDRHAAWARRCGFVVALFLFGLLVLSSV